MSETLLGYLLILGRLCLSTKWGVSSLGMTDSKMEQVQQARIFCGQATRCSYSPHCLIDGCKTMKEVVCTGCEDKKIKFWWCRLAFHLVHLCLIWVDQFTKWFSFHKFVPRSVPYWRNVVPWMFMSTATLLLPWLKNCRWNKCSWVQEENRM